MRMSSGMHSRQTLENIRAALQTIDDRLKGLIAAMEMHKVEEIEVFYHSEANRGMTKLAQFCDSGHEAVKEARRLRGDFGTLPANGQNLHASNAKNDEKRVGKSKAKLAKKP